MFEVLDKIYVASTVEEGSDLGPEVVQICSQPLFERSSVFITEYVHPSAMFNCGKKNAPEMYRCDSCGFEVYLKVNLKVHMEMVHRLGMPISIKNFCTLSDQRYNMSNILKCHSCDRCDFVTHSLLVLFKHQVQRHPMVKLKHKIVAQQQVTPRKVLFPQPRRKYCRRSSASEKRFKCGQCIFSTNNKYQLKKHIEISHRLPEDGQLYECDKCSFKTLDQQRLDVHRVKHDKVREEQWYSCSSCSYATKRKHHLSSHVMNRHTAEEELVKFQCASCPYWAKQKTSLNEHILLKHTSEEDIKWFKCELCPSKCKTRTTLRKHMISHSDTKFLCEICSTLFKRKVSLRRHLLRQHDTRV